MTNTVTNQIARMNNRPLNANVSLYNSMPWLRETSDMKSALIIHLKLIDRRASDVFIFVTAKGSHMSE